MLDMIENVYIYIYITIFLRIRDKLDMDALMIPEALVQSHNPRALLIRSTTLSSSKVEYLAECKIIHHPMLRANTWLAYAASKALGPQECEQLLSFF